MSDIVVNVPTKEIDHFWGDVPDSNIEWWTLSKKPKSLEVGGYIYFAVRGEIKARALVKELSSDTRLCETTNREWSGCHVVWDASKFEKLSPPFEMSKITRGFQYKASAHKVATAYMESL